MELNKIEYLLKKYEEGETTLAEEQTLCTFFNSGNVPKHFKSYETVFTYFKTVKAETFTKSVQLERPKTASYKWVGVAAAVTLLVGVYVNWSLTKNNLGTFQENETQLAYNQFVTSINLVSKNLNAGTSKVNYLQVVTKANEQIKYLNEFKNPIGKIIKTEHFK